VGTWTLLIGGRGGERFSILFRTFSSSRPQLSKNGAPRTGSKIWAVGPRSAVRLEVRMLTVVWVGTGGGKEGGLRAGRGAPMIRRCFCYGKKSVGVQFFPKGLGRQGGDRGTRLFVLGNLKRTALMCLGGKNTHFLCRPCLLVGAKRGGRKASLGNRSSISSLVFDRASTPTRRGGGEMQGCPNQTNSWGPGGFGGGGGGTRGGGGGGNGEPNGVPGRGDGWVRP